MLIPLRQTRLQELLSHRGASDVETLAAELNVSPSTVRRDLETLEQQGMVQRTHGGVVWIGERTQSGRPYALDQRMGYRQDAKRAIARAARSLVLPGQTLLLDGGTTTFYLAQELLGQNLQIVTNSLPIANLFINDDNVELVLTGGLLYPRYGVLLGPTAESAISQMHTKSLFLSVAGIHGGTLYNQNLLLVQAEQRMMQQAQETVLLVDSSKFDQQALVKLCDLSQIDVLVTDAGVRPADREAFEAAGCRVIVAG